jgi:cyanobactin maturation PatA/PatG family protease
MKSISQGPLPMHNITKSHGSGPTIIPGLAELWAQTKGNPDICIAVLDGPVDITHSCFSGAHLTQRKTLVAAVADQGPACSHGTHVTSIIFGQHSSLVTGLAPNCSGLILPIFADGPSGTVAPSSQIDLARAIMQAAEEGAHIINISGGQLAPSGAPDPMLAKAVKYCEQKNVLIVSAAGNDGCDCLHVPASVNSVLAVGAIDAQGDPLGSSNWGLAYQTQGIMAPGKNILGAIPGGEVGVKSGTSFATPIVSGIAALLLSLQLDRGEKPNPQAIRAALISSTSPCTLGSTDVCRRLLKGTLNVPATHQLITTGKSNMNDETIVPDIETGPRVSKVHQGLAPSQEVDVLTADVTANFTDAVVSLDNASALATSTGDFLTAPSAEGVTASACTSCADGDNKNKLVYALGSLGFDFGTEARRDSFIQAMPAGKNNPHVPEHLLDYLKDNPFEASSITWTINLDATPIYAVVPMGPYASTGYDRLVKTMIAMVDGSVELASIPGMVAGSVRLLSGQTVPAIVPAIRGMYSWTTSAMIESALGERPAAGAKQTDYDKTAGGLNNFLSRIYYDMRNLGMTSEERALNYAATNAFQAAQVIESTTKSGLDLDRIDVRKSPVCRPDSDCWDVELHFFNPQNTNVANQVHRFTVDVSDMIPVTIGQIRSFTKR